MDNNSSDDSAEMIKLEFPRVKLIENKNNLGFAKASSQALKQCSGRYILLLNPDILVLNKAPNKLVRFIDSHPRAGAAGCKLLNPNRSLQRSCRSFPSIFSHGWNCLFLDALFPKSKIFGGYPISYLDHDDVRKVGQPLGAALIVRKSAVDEVGLMDEHIFLLFDEVDWRYRIKKKGWKSYFTLESMGHPL